jgi:8-oxo-dGTP diphosphatase
MTTEMTSSIPECAYDPEWRPTEVATLCFVIKAGEILLIRKKRGLGAGKINGPGGRLEPGETPLQAAIRETEEELGVTPVAPEWSGTLRFDFVDGYRLDCCVFTARDCIGTAIETDEAVPLWTPLDAIPYDEMWADDRFWLPGVVNGEKFLGYFRFDGERMLEKAVFWLGCGHQQP